MNLIPLSFILSGLLALPAVAAGLSPAPALVQLDQTLTRTFHDKAEARLAPEQVADFTAKFRVDLAAAKAEAPPTPENATLHAHILLRLGELAGRAAGARPFLGSMDTRSDLSRAHFEENTTPAVITTEKGILSSDPFRGNRDTQDFVSVSGAHRRFRFAAHRAAANLLANLPIPPAPVTDGSSSSPAEAAGLAALAAAGAMMLFGGWGGAELEGRQPGIKTRMGMAAALGGALATAGAFIAPAAPLAAQPQVINAVPDVVARVVPLNQGNRLSGFIGNPADPNVLVTAAEDISSTPPEQLAERLGIEKAPQYAIMRFRTPSGISTPIAYDRNPLFIGRGLTSGEAREFQIPNTKIPADAVIEYVMAKK